MIMSGEEIKMTEEKVGDDSWCKSTPSSLLHLTVEFYLLKINF